MVRSQAPEAPDCNARRVILVEDYDDVRAMMVQLLSPFADIVACKNATQALHYFLDAFRCQQHCGILIDVALPDINGVRTMAAIRELERGSTGECTPIRLGVVSGNTELVANTPTFENLGVSLIVAKPIEPSTFMPIFVDWLKEPAPELYMAARADSSV